MKYFPTVLLICILVITTQCEFNKIDQPKSAQPGEITEILITVYDDLVPEPNAHKGVLCILVPQDWSFVSGNYSGSVGSGVLEEAHDWADSVETCYPAVEIGENMKWIAVISDTGYAYSDPITIDISVKLQVGQTEGCFDLGYLVTKACSGVLCTSWTPISYPHRIGVPDSCGEDQSYKAESAPEWDALFNRNSGWTGADAGYSIPLSGVDSPQESNNGQTLFLYGDTFIGEVDSTGHRYDATIVRNTYAILEGSQPLAEQITFFWETGDNGQPAGVFIPNTPNSNPDNWYWPMDGILLNDTIYVFTLRMKLGELGELFPFEVAGISLISFTIDSVQGIISYEEIDTPLYYKNEEEGWDIVLGQAVMPMTEQSGNPNPDGYIYIYGPRSGFLKKDLVAGRVLPENLTDFSKWEFWDGETWSSEIQNCASITRFISQEFSVTPINNGKFLLVFQINNLVAIRTAENPSGPFDIIYRAIWDCPEVEEDIDIYVYNAKAHPHLSKPKELLISYNVNTFNFLDHFTNAGIYRPRFITLQISQNVADDNHIPELVSLYQNYPNPFNSTTNIKYALPEKAKVVLKIYNVLGQEVRTLVDQNQPQGTYLITWDGENDSGQRVSSGIYFYRVQTNEKAKSRKMILLR